MKLMVLGRGKTGALVAEVAKGRQHDVYSLASQDNPDGRALTPGDADFSPGPVRYSFLVISKNGRLVSRPKAALNCSRPNRLRMFCQFISRSD